MDKSREHISNDEDALDTADVIISDSQLERVRTPEHPFLVVLDGPAMGLVYKLDKPKTVIGRSSSADITIDEDGVSRNHIIIEQTGHGPRVIDIGSRNGLFVNGERVNRWDLLDGDRIQLGSLTVMQFSYRDELEERFQQQLYDASIRDGMTGAFNKRYFLEHLKTEFSWAKRHSSPLSLIIFDLDEFKGINDQYGHPAGDDVLQQVVKIARDALRSDDMLARYGGDEFTVILRSTDREQARIVGERIRTIIDSHEFGSDPVFSVAVSVGVATLKNANFENPEQLTEAADRLLYRAKASGRNILMAE